MSLNKKILIKVKQKTENNPEMSNFLTALLEFESESRGWYKTRYSEILEGACRDKGGEVKCE